MKPIKSKEEYDEVFEKQVIATANRYKMPIDKARVRLRQLLDSELMYQIKRLNAPPDDPLAQYLIDQFMTTQ